MKKAFLLQRVCAYFIDYLIIFVIGILLSNFLMLDTDKYNKAVDNTIKLTEDYSNGDINIDQYYDGITTNNYMIERCSILVTLTGLAVSIGYFGSYAYYKDGQTIGKKVMKIKVVSSDGNGLSLIKFLLRASLISGFYTSILSSFMALVFELDLYKNIYIVLQNINSIFMITTILFTLIRKDNRAIHDLIVGSIVVSI